MLVLASIKTSTLGSEETRRLWARTLELARSEGADRFALDGSNMTEPLVSSDTVVDASTEVVALNVYADDGWVAGISDWGDNISVLFSVQNWERLAAVIERLDPRPTYDVAEAESRPAAPA